MLLHLLLRVHHKPEEGNSVKSNRRCVQKDTYPKETHSAYYIETSPISILRSFFRLERAKGVFLGKPPTKISSDAIRQKVKAVHYAKMSETRKRQVSGEDVAPKKQKTEGPAFNRDHNLQLLPRR